MFCKLRRFTGGHSVRRNVSAGVDRWIVPERRLGWLAGSTLAWPRHVSCARILKASMTYFLGLSVPYQITKPNSNNGTKAPLFFYSILNRGGRLERLDYGSIFSSMVW